GFETVPFDSPADVYIINTCTVTSVADSKSRAAIRRAIRLNPHAFVAVSGCYADLEPGRIEDIEGVDLIVPNTQKDLIPERILAHFFTDIREGSLSVNNKIARPRSRTRAVVKVQDGCDQFCSYCVVPYARPGRRSRPIGEVLKEIEALAGFGYKEVVLTGIRLGAYSDGSTRLPGLIREVSRFDEIRRIRLSSIEPWEIDDEMLDMMRHPKVCRHLHIPLQSGDDDVLARMNRPYTGRQYLDLISRVRKALPDVGITTDVMVGFPGESEAAFRNTVSVVERARFSRLHVFRYSPRKHTTAAEMPNQIDEATKKLRAEKLVEMGRIAVREFARSFVGRVVEVLVESRPIMLRNEKQSPNRTTKRIVMLSGFADNYVDVRFPGSKLLVGEIVPVTITGVDEVGRAVGEIAVTKARYLENRQELFDMIS
ncbi:MAG: tRNA (N(6)-L-threonylcarbamoyladenosine(37)-C(2))-methylthiotransferase MtaB, partial [Armatimonadetes bacterium]|nr:tRNA (N(6)-L-threonylcarbamoyladenosine(37)-C(2))-methylthiotransferase MtaB [Armatimonadota bacterium]